MHHLLTRLISILFLLPLLMSCGGGKLSSQDSEFALKYKGQLFTPPPRSSSDVITKVNLAGVGSAQDETQFCKKCNKPIPPNMPLFKKYNVYSKRAIVAHRRGNTDQALDYLRKANEIADQIELADGKRSKFLVRTAIIYREVGHYSSGVKAIEQAIDLLQGKKKGRRILLHALLAQHQAEIGNIEAAKDAINESQDLYDSFNENSGKFMMHGDWWEANILVAKGKITAAEGKLNEAEFHFREAIDRLRDESKRKLTVYSIQNRVHGYWLVNNLIDQGRIAEAEIESRKAIEFALETFGRNNHATAVVLSGFVKILMARGRYREAEEFTLLIEDIYRQIGVLDSSLSMANILILNADTHVARGDWKLALKAFDRVQASLINDKDALVNYLGVNLNWAITLFQSNRLKRAEEIAVAALQRRTRILGKSHHSVTEAETVLAMIRAKMGKRTQAIETFKKALPQIIEQMFDSTTNREETGVAHERRKFILTNYLSILALQYKKGDKTAAEEAFKVVQLVQSQAVQQAIASSAVRSNIPDKQLAGLVRQEQDLLKQIDASYNYLLTNLSSKKGESSQNAIELLKQRVSSLKQERKQLLKDISSRFPEYDRLVRPRPVAAQEVRKWLGEDESLIMVYPAENQLYVWAIPKKGSVMFASENINASVIDTHVAKLRKSLNPEVTTLNQVFAFDTDISHELYRSIMLPVEAGWKSSKNLIIIPTGSLGTLPFSVLVTQDIEKPQGGNKQLFTEYRDVPWLARTHATSYIPSVNSIVSLRSLAEGKKDRSVFAGFGNPKFSPQQADKKPLTVAAKGSIKLQSRGLRRIKSGSLDKQDISSGQLEMLQGLPDTEDEVTEIARVLNADIPSSVFLGNNANESTVKGMVLHDRKVVMFATHALLPNDLDGLDQPAIALTSPKITNNKDEDGLLTMSEILGLKLDADWVVLSACNTGAGSGKGAGAVSGMGMAFFYAGSRALLVSHWPVETTSARYLTTNLFKNQAMDSGLTRSGALAKTINTMIDSGVYQNKETGKTLFSYAHPMFWAPFTIVGNGLSTINN